jgi:hypothetical protein
MEIETLGTPTTMCCREASEATETGSGCATRTLKKTALLNRKAVKRFVLDYCKRSPKSYVRNNMTRVSEQVFIDIESKVREVIRTRVDGQPSKGKTVT